MENGDDLNITDDYNSDNNYAYAVEDDFEIVSVQEFECHQNRLDWDQLKSLGLVNRTCPPFWDRISCWPPVEEGVTASIPCPTELRGIAYDTSKSAYLSCLSPTPGDNASELLWPEWASKSNYGACVPRATENALEVEALPMNHYEVLSLIYLCGYSISLVALVVATTIFIYFKEMRCLRNKIHSNLFLTFILTNSCWIITSVMQNSVHNSNSSLEVSWCVSLIFSRYFHLATFFWMFVEGLFLFVQVIATFSVEDSRMKFRHYFLIGWGLPLIVMCIWAVFTQSTVLEQRQKMLQNINNTQQPIMHQCPFLEVNKHHEWIYMGPVFLLLATNAFFLVSIFYVVVTKLRSTGQREASDHQNWRAAKALLVIIPLLGITYLITIAAPSDTSSVIYIIFVHFRAVLLSTQGLTVTLPYCFLNTEVKGILHHHWNRWRNTRNVEHNYSRGHSARNSISLAGYYACDSNSTFLSASRRNSFLRLHSMYLSGSHGHQHRSGQESQLVTSVLLERCGDSAVRHSNRIIPVIQEETRTPSPSTFISRSGSPTAPTLNQLSPTVISVTPATPTPSPTQNKVRITISETEHGESNVTLFPGHASGNGTVSPDQLSCFSSHSSPVNRCPSHSTTKPSSLLDLDIPENGFNNKSLSSCTLPQQQATKMPDILNFPSPIPGTFSSSCPSVSNHKEKR